MARPLGIEDAIPRPACEMPVQMGDNRSVSLSRGQREKAVSERYSVRYHRVRLASFLFLIFIKYFISGRRYIQGCESVVVYWSPNVMGTLYGYDSQNGNLQVVGENRLIHRWSCMILRGVPRQRHMYLASYTKG